MNEQEMLRGVLRKSQIDRAKAIEELQDLLSIEDTTDIPAYDIVNACRKVTKEVIEFETLEQLAEAIGLEW